jgi:hypothetical protein
LRNLLIIPLFVALVGGGALGASRAFSWALPWHELAVVAGLCMVSAELSLIPALRAQRSGPAAVAQAALLGTVAHMLLTVVLAAVAWSAHLMPMQRQAFIYLLLAFYWVSLIGLVIALVRIIRGTAVANLQIAGGKLS